MGGSARKLIVVDDDPVDVRFVMRAFSDAGSPIEITHVADAEAASDRNRDSLAFNSRVRASTIRSVSALASSTSA